MGGGRGRTHKIFLFLYQNSLCNQVKFCDFSPRHKKYLPEAFDVAMTMLKIRSVLTLLCKNENISQFRYKNGLVCQHWCCFGKNQLEIPPPTKFQLQRTVGVLCVITQILAKTNKDNDVRA